MKKLARLLGLTFALPLSMFACGGDNQQAAAIADPGITMIMKAETAAEAGENNRKYIYEQILGKNNLPHDDGTPDTRNILPKKDGIVSAKDYFDRALPADKSLPSLTNGQTIVKSALAFDLADLQKQYYQLVIDRCEVIIQMIPVSRAELDKLDAFIDKETSAGKVAGDVLDAGDVDQLVTELAPFEQKLKTFHDQINKIDQEIEKLYRDNPGSFKSMVP